MLTVCGALHAYQCHCHMWMRNSRRGTVNAVSKDYKNMMLLDYWVQWIILEHFQVQHTTLSDTVTRPFTLLGKQAAGTGHFRQHRQYEMQFELCFWVAYVYSTCVELLIQCMYYYEICLSLGTCHKILRTFRRWSHLPWTICGTVSSYAS